MILAQRTTVSSQVATIGRVNAPGSAIEMAHWGGAQLAFTGVGPFLVGGHSDETFGHDRAGNTQLLIERMGMIVVSAETYIDSDEIAEPAEPGAAPGGSTGYWC